MRPILVSLLSIFFCFTVLADEISDAAELNLPEGLELMSGGYPSAPIVQCPRPAKKYVDMLAQLDSIRTRIRTEACRDSGEIESIENGVADLQSLITTQRKSFIDLIKKGTTAGQQLSSQEVKELETYIDQVVKKASVVTDFLNNEACFDEPAKFSTLGTLSSVIGEISGAIGALAGPFGAKISLAGNVLSGLLRSINTIVTARTSYDADVEADRVNYLNTLCAYYDFKSDFDKETKTLLYDRKLRGLRDSAQALLDTLAERCADCELAIEDFQDRFYNDRSFVMRRREATTYVETLSAEDLGPDDLVDRYFLLGFSEDDAAATDEEIEDLIVEGGAGVGSEATQADQQATATALLTKAWAETERQKLIEGEDLGASDELRKPILDRQNQIEDVLFRNVAPDYVTYHRKLLEDEFQKLQGMGRQVISQMYSFRPAPDTEMDYSELGSSLAIAFHDLFRSDLEFIESDNPLMQYEQALLWDYVDQASAGLMDQFDVLRRQYALMQQRCDFYENSLYDLRRASGLRRACERAKGVMGQIADEMAKVEMTSFGKEFDFYFKIFKASEIEWAADWLESVTRHMTQERQARL